MTRKQGWPASEVAAAVPSGVAVAIAGCTWAIRVKDKAIIKIVGKTKYDSILMMRDLCGAIYNKSEIRYEGCKPKGRF
jgi:hypothetical protein